MNELLNCAHCGYDAALESMQVRKGYEATIQCLSCLSSMHTITYDSEQEAIDVAIAAWNTRDPVNEWISVKDRLPDIDEIVLVYFRNEILIGHMNSWSNHGVYTWDIFTNHGIWTGPENVTHWQPLPAPPHETTEKEKEV